MRDLFFVFLGIIGGMLIGWSIRDYSTSNPDKLTGEEFELRLRQANDRIERALKILEQHNAQKTPQA